MRAFLKSLISEVDFDSARLIENETNPSESDEDSDLDRTSVCNDYQESCDVSESSETDCGSLTQSEDTTNGHNTLENTESKNIPSFARGSFMPAISDAEMVLPIKGQHTFRPCHSNENIYVGFGKGWNLRLRVPGNTLPNCGKLWRPVLVKLEEATLKLHAEDFESSPPFRTVHLTWFHSFRTPAVQTHITRGEFLFTTVLLNALYPARGTLAKCEKRYGFKEMKVACANYAVLLNFIETVQKCISCFPAFRQQGIRCKREKMLIHVEDLYEATQKERDKPDNVAVKQVQIMLKAKVSARPECSLRVKHAQSEVSPKQQAIDEASFHKCIQSYSSNNQTVTVRFLPLDNCWFQLMSWTSYSSRPVPLRCEVTMMVCAYSCIQLRASIFTGSTRLEATSAKDLTLRFYIPVEWLETERKPAVQTIQQCTNVSKGNVSYNPSVETMVWSIPKLPFKSCRNFFLTGNPIASLRTEFKPPPCCGTQEMAKVPVEMDFSMKTNACMSEVEMTNMKLGLKSFRKFKTSYSSTYRIQIPVTRTLT